MQAAKSGAKTEGVVRGAVWLLGALLLLLVVAYASLPQLISALAKSALSAQGFADVSLSVSYPRWGELRLTDLHAQGRAFGQSIELRLDNVEIDFEWRDLVAARVGHVRIRNANASLKPVPVAGERAAPAHPLSIVALLPGRWLLWLPAHQVLLEQAQIVWRSAGDVVYQAQFSGHARSEEARLEGTVGVAEPAQSLQFLGLARASGELELTAWSNRRAEPALELAALLAAHDDDNIELRGTAHATIETLLPLVASQLDLSGVDGARGRLEAQWRARLSAQPVADLATLSASSTFSATAALQARVPRVADALHALEIDLRVEAKLADGITFWRIVDGSRLTGRVAVLAGDAGKTEGPRLDVAFPGGATGQLRYGPEELAVTVNRDVRLSVQPVALFDVTVPESTVTFTEAATLSRVAQGVWSLRPARLALEASPLNWREHQLSHEGVTLQLDELSYTGTEWRTRGVLDAHNLSAHIGAHLLKPAQLHAAFESDAQQFTSQARLTAVNGAAVVNAAVSHRIADGTGNVRAVLEPVTFGETGVTLKRLFDRPPYPLELNAGQMRAITELSWRRERYRDHQLVVVDEHVAANFQDLGGSYQDITFSGVSASVDVADLDTPRTTEPVQLKAAIVNLGVLIENVQGTAHLVTETVSGQPVITLTQLSAELLGGTATSERIEWSPVRERSTFGVRLEHLELAEIMKLEQQEGLEGSGVLDGYLPIELSAAGLALQGGAVQARSPGGTIRYRPEASVATLAKSNPGVALVLGALSDFRYDSLNVRADATPAGDLRLALQLKGANPSWQSGRPVHLNLNVEENIPDLLRSLRIAGEVSEELGKRVQERYQQKR